MLAPASRRAAVALSCTMLVGGLAGCGAGDDASPKSAAAAPASGVDGRMLLNDAAKKLTPDGAPLTSGTLGVTISGKVDAPKDKDIKQLDGKLSLTVSAERATSKGAIPPVKVAFTVDGTYTSGDGKPGSARYTGGASYLDDQLYVNWKGKDYAFGKALTQQFAQGFGQGFTRSFEEKAGDTTTLKALTADPAKLRDALALEPGDWLTAPTVTDGPQLDGVATYAVRGPIDLKAAASDLTEGFKNLPAAFPDVPGVKDLAQMGDVDASDLAKTEQRLPTRTATVYVGKDDHVQRRIVLRLGGSDDAGSSPMSADLTIQIDTTKLNQSQGIAAPKNAAPVTDLFAALQQDFPGIGGLLGG